MGAICSTQFPTQWAGTDRHDREAAHGAPVRCKKDTLLESALAGGPMPAAEVVQIMSDHGPSENLFARL